MAPDSRRRCSVEAIRKYQHCVIVGDPGAGKTTLLKFLTLSAADKKLKDLPDLPIHIELNAFAANTAILTAKGEMIAKADRHFVVSLPLVYSCWCELEDAIGDVKGS